MLLPIQCGKSRVDGALSAFYIDALLDFVQFQFMVDYARHTAMGSKSTNGRLFHEVATRYSQTCGFGGDIHRGV